MDSWVDNTSITVCIKVNNKTSLTFQNFVNTVCINTVGMVRLIKTIKGHQEMHHQWKDFDKCEPVHYYCIIFSLMNQVIFFCLINYWEISCVYNIQSSKLLTFIQLAG
jgi:hypothetical protein